MLHLMNCLYLLMVHFILENLYLMPDTSCIWQAISGALKRGQAIRDVVSTPQFPTAAHFLALFLPPLTYANLPPLDHLSCTSQELVLSSHHLYLRLSHFPLSFARKYHSCLWLSCFRKFLVPWGTVLLLESFMHPLRHSRSSPVQKNLTCDLTLIIKQSKIKTRGRSWHPFISLTFISILVTIRQ